MNLLIGGTIMTKCKHLWKKKWKQDIHLNGWLVNPKDREIQEENKIEKIIIYNNFCVLCDQEKFHSFTVKYDKETGESPIISRDTLIVTEHKGSYSVQTIQEVRDIK